MRLTRWLPVAAVLVLAACDGGKQATVEGKLVDWNGKPVAGMKITASQVQPIKGYEHFEAITKADGTFRLRGLFPSSSYVLKPWSDKWTTKTAVRIETAPQGEISILPAPMTIAQVYSKSRPSLVADIATGAVGHSTVEGKLVDWNGKPVAGVKLIAAQARPNPNKEYELFETVTAADGTFRFRLLASSKYVLIPRSDKWSTKTSVSGDSPPHHGDTAVLTAPMTIARAYSKSGREVGNLGTGAPRFIVSSEGVITDSRTGLRWVVGPDRDTNYHQAVAWLTASNIAGGEWRMPTRKQLKTLYREGLGKRNMDPVFKTTGLWVWAGPRGPRLAWRIYFPYGTDDSRIRSLSSNGRVFGVRSRPRR